MIVDTLRATTTMCAMLANDARAVLPVANVEQAREWKRTLGDVLLAGERSNVPPVGFDGGNSPLEYPPERVAGHSVVLTTTNGTQAVERCQESRAMVAAALVNASAVGRWLEDRGGETVIVLAGSHGGMALEDWITGGAIVDTLKHWTWSDEARAAHWAYAHVRNDLYHALAQTSHGAELETLNMRADIVFAARLDGVSVVPVRGEDGWFCVDR